MDKSNYTRILVNSQEKFGGAGMAILDFSSNQKMDLHSGSAKDIQLIPYFSNINEGISIIYNDVYVNIIIRNLC